MRGFKTSSQTRPTPSGSRSSVAQQSTERISVVSSIPGADLALDDDPDRDLYTSMEEFQLGLNPTVANRWAGCMLTDLWNSIVGTTVGQLVSSSSFYMVPGAVTFWQLSELKFTNADASTRSRSRGYLTPMVSGNDTFWLSAKPVQTSTFPPISLARNMRNCVSSRWVRTSAVALASAEMN